MPEEKILEGKESKKSSLLPFVVVVIAALVLIFASKSGETDKAAVVDDEAPAEETLVDEAEQPASPLLADMHKLVLAKNFESWTPDAQVDFSKTISNSIVAQGELDKVYLFVKATVEGEPLTSFDSLYFKLVYDGGHLFRPESLELPESDGTTLLYDLRDVPYLLSVPYDESLTPERVDLQRLLVPNKRVLATSFVSSMRPGRLEDLTIYYSCAEGSECSLSLD